MTTHNDHCDPGQSPGRGTPTGPPESQAFKSELASPFLWQTGKSPNFPSGWEEAQDQDDSSA